MFEKQKIGHKRAAIFIILFVFFIGVAAALAFKSSREQIKTKEAAEETAAEGAAKETAAWVALKSNDGLSKATLSVKNMSCAGCISTIKGSVADIEGIGDVRVDIVGGKVDIFYDSKAIEDLSEIADEITASGYPASVQKVLSPEELRDAGNLSVEKSKDFIASVGGWDIARADWDIEMEIARKRYGKTFGDRTINSEKKKAMEDSIKRQIIARLIDEGLVMVEIGKAGYRVDAETVDREFQLFLKKNNMEPDAFKGHMNDIGYGMAYFRTKFERGVLIDKYLSERILIGASNELERRNLLNSWYNNVKGQAPVVYYDREIQSLAQSQSPSGGCCNR